MKIRPAKPIEPEDLRSQVAQMANSDAFMHLCAYFAAKVGTDVSDKAMLPKTSDDETLVLKKAKQVLETFNPAVLAEEIIQGASNEIERLKK